MIVEEGLPYIFRRAFPVLQEGTAILVAGSALDIPRRAVLPIVSIGGTGERSISLARRRDGCLAFSGYSLIQHLLRTEPEAYYRFLFEPCERAVVTCRLAGSGRTELAEIIDTFVREGFGWAFLERDASTHAYVTLSDLIPLYRKGILRTRMKVGDVATRNVLALPGATKLSEALTTMMGLRVRKTFVEGKDGFVSDREILTHILSPERLGVARARPQEMLEPTLDEVGLAKPMEVDAEAELAEVAGLFRDESGACCAVCAGGVVTPWDMIVKPWQAGRLAFDETTRARGRQEGRWAEAAR